MSKVLAIDFDGTIVEHQFPEIGPELPHATRVLRRLSGFGFDLVLNTCREDYPITYVSPHATTPYAHPDRKFLTETLEWCAERGVHFAAANMNADHHMFGPGSPAIGRKILADYYIDDHNFGGFPGWLVIEKYFLG